MRPGARGNTGPQDTVSKPCRVYPRAACFYALVLWGSSLIVPRGLTQPPLGGGAQPGGGSHPCAADW